MSISLTFYTFLFLFIIKLFTKEFYEEKVVSRSGHLDQDVDVVVLNKFRELVDLDGTLYKNYMKSDQYLVRWLEATDFNAKEANKMLRKALKWRKDSKIDGIENEVIFEQISPMIILNETDYEGSTVITFRVSGFDTRRVLLMTGRVDDCVRYFTQLLERAEIAVLGRLGLIGNNSISTQGPATDKVTIIINVQGYNLRQHACLKCFSAYLKGMQMIEDNYPSYFKHLIFINAPRIFKPLIELMKPIMSNQTRNALQTYGINKTEWTEVLRKIIPYSIESIESYV